MVSLWERTYSLMGRTDRPPLTRLMVEMMSVDQRYPIDRARRELGYGPRIGYEEGLRLTGAWLREQGMVGPEAVPAQ